MKKGTLANFIIIIGLLVLCVMTLIAVYATAPDSSVLLLDENFEVLDENTWKEKVSECKEDEQFHYLTENDNNRVTADGVLHIYANLTNKNLKSKRESSISNCFSCSDLKNSSYDCITSFISGKIQSKHKFDAESGQIEIRAKVNPANRTQFYIGVSVSQKTSETEDLQNSLESENNTTENNSTELKIFFESDFRKSILRSVITDSKFHVYQINWSNGKIYLNVDNKKVDEKAFERVDLREENYSSERVKLVNGTPISQPFYLSLGVHIGKKYLKSMESFLNSNKSLNATSDYEENDFENENVLEVDYLRLFKTIN